MKNLSGSILLLALMLLSQVAPAQKSGIPPVKTIYNYSINSWDSLPSDTTTSGSQIYHPLYTSFPIWYELGNLGFPALPACWTGISRLNEAAYIRPIRQYASNPDVMTFYDTKSPFAMLTYTSGGTQDVNGQVINAIFARHISPSLRILANLDFINSEGHYVNEKSSHSDFSLNADYHKNRYSIKAGVETLSFDLGENGGIKSSSISFPWTATEPQYRIVNLTGAASNTKWTILKGRQEFDFMAKITRDSTPSPGEQIDSLGMMAMVDSMYFDPLIADSTDSLNFEPDIIESDSISEDVETAKPFLSKGPKPKLFHSFDYQFSQRLYKDQQSSTGSYYQNYYINSKEAADSVKFNLFSNKFGLAKTGLLGDSLSWFGQAGLGHNFARWYSNNYSGIYQQVDLFADLLAVYKNWLLNLGGQFTTLGYGLGSYDFNASIENRPHVNKLKYSLSFESILDLPSVFHQAYSGNHDRWINDASMQGEQRIGLITWYDRWKLGGGASLNLISNWAYFDESGKPQQSDYSTILLSGNIKKDFKAGPFNSRNMVFVQYTPAREIPLPLVVASTSTFMHHDIYFPKTNGKLELEYGIDLRYSSSYYGYAYRPSTGAFHLQESKQLGNYPYLDLFLILRVKRTRVFVKWEHVNADFTGENFFPVLNYPTKVRFIKYGVYWHFYD